MKIKWEMPNPAVMITIYGLCFIAFTAGALLDGIVDKKLWPTIGWGAGAIFSGFIVVAFWHYRRKAKKNGIVF